MADDYIETMAAAAGFVWDPALEAYVGPAGDGSWSVFRIIGLETKDPDDRAVLEALNAATVPAEIQRYGGRWEPADWVKIDV